MMRLLELLICSIFFYSDSFDFSAGELKSFTLFHSNFSTFSPLLTCPQVRQQSHDWIYQVNMWTDVIWGRVSQTSEEDPMPVHLTSSWQHQMSPRFTLVAGGEILTQLKWQRFGPREGVTHPVLPKTTIQATNTSKCRRQKEVLCNGLNNKEHKRQLLSQLEPEPGLKMQTQTNQTVQRFDFQKR